MILHLTLYQVHKCQQKTYHCHFSYYLLSTQITQSLRPCYRIPVNIQSVSLLEHAIKICVCFFEYHWSPAQIDILTKLFGRIVEFPQQGMSFTPLLTHNNSISEQ